MSASTTAAAMSGHHHHQHPHHHHHVYHRHQRSISDGSGPSRPTSSPTWDSAQALLAEVYAKRPLPPIPRGQHLLRDVPIPAPLNIRKHRSREIYAPASSALAQAVAQSLAQQSLAPSLPASLPARSLSSVDLASSSSSSFSPPPTPPTAAAAVAPVVATTSEIKASNRMSSGSTGNKRKSSRKIFQLIGQDVDVPSGPPPSSRGSDKLMDPFKKPFRNSGSSCKSSSSHGNGSTARSRGFSAIGHDLYVVGPRGDRDSVPGLELDLDDMSSRNSSCSPVTPHSTSMASTSRYQSLHHCACSGTQFCSCPVHEEDLLVEPCACERLNDQFSDADELTDEYHQFATELAALKEKSQPPSAVPESPESRVMRMSAFVHFPPHAPSGRRRVVSSSVEPSPALHSLPSTTGNRCVSARISVTTAPLSEKPEPAPERAPEPESERLHSVFDVDSDDEQENERKGRSRWRRDRGKSETGGRPQAWSRTGDQMRDLLSSAKDKARALPNATRGDRRK